MRRVTFVILLIVLLLAACAPAATGVPTLSIPETGNTSTPAVVTTDTASTTAEATEPPTTEATASTGTGASTIMTSQSADVTGNFLVDDQGRTLYVFANDTQNSGTSACTDSECMSEWPAVVVSGTPTAGTGVDATQLGTI